MSFKALFVNNWSLARQVAVCAPGYALASFLHGLLAASESVALNALLINYLYDALAQRLALSAILWVLAAAGLLIAARLGLGAYLDEALRPRAAAQLNLYMQRPLLERACALDLARYDQPEFYDEFVWAAAEADTRALAVFDSAMRLVSCLIHCAGFLGVMLQLNPGILLPAAAYFACSTLLSVRQVRLSYQRDERLKPEERRAGYAGRVFALKEYASELRTSPIAGPVLRLHAQTMAQARSVTAWFGRRLFALSAAQEGLAETVLLNGVLYGYLAYCLLVRRSLTIGSMMSLAFSAENILWRVSELIGMIPRFSEHALYAGRYLQFLKAQPQLLSGRLPPPEGALSLEGVCFRYPGGGPMALSGLSFTLHPGEKIAIVGYNGAGKSTLIRLLTRLYDPSAGRITLGGIDVRQLRLSEYRAQFGVVFQAAPLYALTLLENVAMEPEGDRERAEQALLQAGFSEALHRMPKGLDTPLTREFDPEGVELSGGEAQKVAIARALYRAPRILLLDEPASQLDPASEYELNHLMMDAARDQTVVFISHRLATTRMADTIYMMEGGRIVEKGSHRELMEKDGAYARLFRLQAAQYGL